MRMPNGYKQRRVFISPGIQVFFQMELGFRVKIYKPLLVTLAEDNAFPFFRKEERFGLEIVKDDPQAEEAFCTSQLPPAEVLPIMVTLWVSFSIQATMLALEKEHGDVRQKMRLSATVSFSLNFLSRLTSAR